MVDCVYGVYSCVDLSFDNNYTYAGRREERKQKKQEQWCRSAAGAWRVGIRPQGAGDTVLNRGTYRTYVSNDPCPCVAMWNRAFHIPT